MKIPDTAVLVAPIDHLVGAAIALASVPVEVAAGRR